MKTKTSLIAGLTMALLFGSAWSVAAIYLPPPPKVPKCQSWDVSGKWQFRQGSGKGALNVDLDLGQKGIAITGTARHQPGGRVVAGTVSGTVLNDKFTVNISWDNKTTGVYDGTIRSSGTIEGTGYEQRSSGTKVNWSTETRMVCADKKAAPATTPRGVVPGPDDYKKLQDEVNKAAAKVTPAQLPPKPQVEPPATGPTITASPRVVAIPPGQATGTTTLTWDAGKDHPYAEVWVKVDDEDETQIVEQGKGSRRVTVRPGETYLYILTDSGQRLSTVTVTTK